MPCLQWFKLHTHFGILQGVCDRTQEVHASPTPPSSYRNQVTDHQIGLTLMNLTSVLESNRLQDFIFIDTFKIYYKTIMEDILGNESQW
jgi:hypothetical protein